MIPKRLLTPPLSHSPSSAPEDGERPRKKNKGKGKARDIKTEVGASAGTELAKAQRPLTPFTVPARFYTACYIDTTRAAIDLSTPDVSTPNSATQAIMPVRLIPNADIAAMSQLPIVQSPTDPSKVHPKLPQPAAINPNIPLAQGGTYASAAHQAREQINTLLQSPMQRQEYERKHFSLTRIETRHLPEHLAGHATIGMRGVVAAQPLKAGSPLQYSGQYLDKSDYEKTARQLSQELQTKTAIKPGEKPGQADYEAHRLIDSYAWEAITYKGKKYTISAFGAGNTAAMINHDSQHPNMGVAYMSTHDDRGQPAPQIVVYFALRDIAEGEQLLVNYGEQYQFDQRAEGSMATTSHWPQATLSANIYQAITAKTEHSQGVITPNDDDTSAATILMGLSSDNTGSTASTSNADSGQASADSGAASSDSEHSITLPPLATPLTAVQQQALDTFNQMIPQKLKIFRKQEDAQEHAAFFFSQESIGLKIKQSLLGDVLFKIIDKNESGALKKLRANWQVLKQLQPAVSPSRWLEIAKHCGGTKTLEHILSNWTSLRDLQPKIPPEKLLDIANNDSGHIALSTIAAHWQALIQLQPRIPQEKLLEIANNGGGGGTLLYIQQHWKTMNQLQPPITVNQWVQAANRGGGSTTLNYLQQHWTELNQLQPTIKPSTLMAIANNNGGSKTLNALKEHWIELTQLRPAIAPERILDIANKPGGSNTLKTLKENWNKLTAFTNHKGETITVQQLEQISNRKVATKGLEILLHNDHIKTLAIKEVVHILVNDSRTAKFLKAHPNQ